MGFFTLELARVVGPSGRVVAVDVQPEMNCEAEAAAGQSGDEWPSGCACGSSGVDGAR